MTAVAAGTIGRVAGETPFVLRIPKDMKAELEALAKQSMRSLNAEILYRLRESITAERDNPKS